MELYVTISATEPNGGNVGIQASYWLTGGIMTVLGLAVARLLLGLLGGAALAAGAFLLKAALTVFLATVALFMVWLVLRMVRRQRARGG